MFLVSKSIMLPNKRDDHFLTSLARKSIVLIPKHSREIIDSAGQVDMLTIWCLVFFWLIDGSIVFYFINAPYVA